MDDKHEVQPLTLSEAQKLYNRYLENGIQLKNGNSSDIEMSPDWQRGVLYEDDRWYVVESPLEFTGNRKITLMKEEVFDYMMEHKLSTTWLRQLKRLVMVRDKETGTTYAFNMYIMPNVEYMQHPESLEANTFLERMNDLSGRVAFYDTDGNLINGWEYIDGKIIKGFIEKEKSGNSLKGTIEKYEWQCTPYIEEGLQPGEDALGSGVLCELVQTLYLQEPDPIIGGDKGGGVFDPGPLDGGGGEKSDDNPIKVPDGDCVIGVIAEALRKYTKTTPDVNKIREQIKNNTTYQYTPGEGINPYQVPDALMDYFDISMFDYEESVTKALDDGKLVVGHDKEMKHAVLITGYGRNLNGKVIYNHYDAVAGRTYYTTLGSDRYDFHILENVKK